MGFVEDIEWILTMTPQDRQILLFSATLPEPIRRIAEQHLKDPKQITVKGRSITADSIVQRFVFAMPREKTDMLTRILESNTTDGVIVFVKTRNATVEVAEKLVDAGYSAAHLNGDMPQSHRERTVENFRSGKLAVLVATDVAARGLDVDRVSHVINYDFPHDVEAYVHRIGRTGRAGRSGQAILFVGRSEKGRLGRIEAETNQKLELMQRPSIRSINENRIARFKQQIVETATQADLRLFTKLVTEVQAENDLSSVQIAAALAKLVQGDVPLEMKERPRRKHDEKLRSRNSDGGDFQGGRGGDGGFKRTGSKKPAIGMQRYRIEVGRAHGVGPKNIVGAIANESGIDSSNIGRIEIHDLHSTIDLPEVLDSNFFRSLKGVRVGGQQLRLTKDEAKRFGKPGGKKDFGKRKFDKPARAKAKNKSTVKANGRVPFKAKARKQRVK
jgi:ATP-dependent RNA helicase DeaD